MEQTAAMSYMSDDELDAWRSWLELGMPPKMVNPQERLFTSLLERLMTDKLQVPTDDQRLFCESLLKVLEALITCDDKMSFADLFQRFSEAQSSGKLAQGDHISMFYEKSLVLFSGAIERCIHPQRLENIDKLVYCFWFGRHVFYNNAQAQVSFEKCATNILDMRKHLFKRKNNMYLENCMEGIFLGSVAMQTTEKTWAIIKRLMSDVKCGEEIFYSHIFPHFQTAHALDTMKSNPNRAEELFEEAEAKLEKFPFKFALTHMEIAMLHYARNRLDRAEAGFQTAQTCHGKETAVVTFTRGTMQLLDVPELKDELTEGWLAFMPVPVGLGAHFFKLYCRFKSTGKIPMSDASDYSKAVATFDKGGHFPYDEAYANAASCSWHCEKVMTCAVGHLMAAIVFKRCSNVDGAKKELEVVNRKFGDRWPTFQKRMSEL